MDTVENERWYNQYEKARKEYAEAEIQYKLADDALAVATSRRNQAERALNRLFHERANKIKA